MLPSGAMRTRPPSSLLDIKVKEKIIVTYHKYFDYYVALGNWSVETNIKVLFIFV